MPLPILCIIPVVSFFFALNDMIPSSVSGIINFSVTIGKPIVFVSVWVRSPVFCTGRYSSTQELPVEYVWFCEQSTKWTCQKTVNYQQLASADVLPEDLNGSLLDQEVALVFIQENIVHFGGNPSKVLTIFVCYPQHVEHPI